MQELRPGDFGSIWGCVDSAGFESGEVIVGVGFCHLDPEADVDHLLRGVRAAGPTSEESTVARFVDLQKASDAGFPNGCQHYWKSGSITEMKDDTIETILEHVGRMPSSTSGVGLQQLHGAAARVAPTATAYLTATIATTSSSCPSGPTRPTTPSTLPGQASSSLP